MSTAGEQSPSAEELESRLEFETLIADTSASLFSNPPEQLHRAVEHALQRVRVFFRADRCALLTVSADQQVLNLRFASFGEGLPAVPADLNIGPLFPWSKHRALVERAIVRVSRMSDLPPDADVERASWIQFGTRSSLTIPIETAGAIRHLIVVDTVHEEREWPDAFVIRLRVLGEMLVGALERQAMFDGIREVEKLNGLAADALRASRARLSSAAELAGLGFYEGNFAEGVIYVDDRFCELCGIPPSHRQGLQPQVFFFEHIHPDDLPRISSLCEQLNGGPLDHVSTQYRYRHPAHGDVWLDHEARVARRDATGRAVATFGVVRDVTERKRAEEELRDLSRRLIRAHEEERALLARELHDDITQRLAVLAIDAGRAELAAADEAVAGTMRSMRETLVRLSEDVHSLAYHLHPSVLTELGLVEALRAECERRARQNRIEIALDLDPLPDGLGKDAALCLFRVTQEALTNVVRHARSAAARVTLRQMSGGLLLAVRDDGVGFDMKRLGEGGRLGLASMRERVRLANGTLDIESAPGRGTAVVAWVPMEGEST